MPIDIYHPKRLALMNELHARPFPHLTAPAQVAFIAFKQVENAAERPPEDDRAHLTALLQHYSAPGLGEEADHYYGKIGDVWLKWERHTEFVTYTLFREAPPDRPYAADLFAFFPAHWLNSSNGKLFASCNIHIEQARDKADATAKLVPFVKQHLVAESSAAAFITEDEAAVASDFRLDSKGHVRFAIFAIDGIGQRRLGRIIQRLLEVETYKSMAMLALPIARNVFARVGVLDRELSDIAEKMAAPDTDYDHLLNRLLALAAEAELLNTRSSFRFSAAVAYSRIVQMRIDVLQEKRVLGRQLFSEFMLRRFDPAMRTCQAAQARLQSLSTRSERAANLLRTRVDVATARQNQSLLDSMNQRAETALRLQQTVEGLSVVAISYYALSLLAYIVAPVAKPIGIEKGWLLAGLAPLVILLVWYLVRRIRKSLGH